MARKRKLGLDEDVTLGELADAEARGEWRPEMEVIRAAIEPLTRLIEDLGHTTRLLTAPPEPERPSLGIGGSILRLEEIQIEKNARALARALREIPVETPVEAPEDAARRRSPPHSRAEWAAFVQEVQELRAEGRTTEAALRLVAKRHDLHRPTLRTKFHSQPKSRKK
jgi:hypothetical protein